MFYKASYRKSNGNWIELREIYADSMAMARCIAFNELPVFAWIGIPGEFETHRPVKGRVIYEYNRGAICIERVG